MSGRVLLNCPLGESLEDQSWSLESLRAVLAAAAEAMDSDHMERRDRAVRLMALARDMVGGWIDAIDDRMEHELSESPAAASAASADDALSSNISVKMPARFAVPAERAAAKRGAA